MQLLGKHNQENAIACIAIAKSLHIDDTIIKQGIEATVAEKGRLEIIQTNHHQVINDCYNASPSSTKFALETLASFDGETIAILGDMAELGDKSIEMHEKIGEYAKTLNIHYLYSVGDLAKHYGFTHFRHLDDVTLALKQHSNSIVLLKASRSSKL